MRKGKYQHCIFEYIMVCVDDSKLDQHSLSRPF